MEAYKMLYLKRLLERRPEVSLEDYLKALKVKEKEARACYSEPLNHIGGENFVKMMLLDGCFIIELIRESAMGGNDLPLAHFTLSRAMLDLLLVENQLPFIILSELFIMTGMPNDQAEDFMDMAIKFFSKIMPGSLGRPVNKDIKHLLGLLHESSQASSSDCEEVCCFCLPELKLNCCSSEVVQSSPPEPQEYHSCCKCASDSNSKEWRFISSATELNEAGINFKKIKGKLFDIKFQKGVMSIPTLSVNDDTESILRNLVAYEQCFKGASPKCFTDYLTFMDCLINTAKDVELLCLHGVIDNWFGDHEVVATLFNKLRNSVLISKDNFSYAGIFIEVNKHCKRKWNLWKANLWHNYFNTPWAGISFCFAVFWLLLTVLDTVFEILYYFKSWQGSQNISPNSSPYSSPYSSSDSPPPY